MFGYDIFVLFEPWRCQLAWQCMENDHAGSSEFFFELFEGANSSNLAASLDVERKFGEVFWVSMILVDGGALVGIPHVDDGIVSTLIAAQQRAMD